MKKCFILLIFCLFILSSQSFAQEFTVKQGKTLSVTLPPAYKITGQIFGKEIKFYPYEGKLRALIGIDMSTAPGKYPLILKIEGENGYVVEREETVLVKKNVFPREWVGYIPKVEREALSKQIEEDQNKLEAVLSLEVESKFGEGKFILPVKGEYSSYFGTYREGPKIVYSRHKGLDIAAPMGTLIRAANAGIVVFSGWLTTNGNTIVIDHGQGLQTIYLHMSKRKVEEGARVEKGQLIALVGSGGISTGPHLHFGVSIHDVRVNPMDWIKGIIAD